MQSLTVLTYSKQFVPNIACAYHQYFINVVSHFFPYVCVLYICVNLIFENYRLVQSCYVVLSLYIPYKL